MKTIIFANGEIEEPKLLDNLIRDRDYLIAADGGLRHIRDLGLIPDLVVGDLDSVTDDDIQWLKNKEVEIREFPRDKDQTDLEIAIYAALDHGADPLIIAGALGGRIDQTLANIYILLMPELQDVDARLDDGQEELFLVQHNAIVRGAAGDIVSLIPLNNMPANGIVAKGLKFRLDNEILFPERSRGISNVMIGDIAEINLKSGLLLCIHKRLIGGEK